MKRNPDTLRARCERLVKRWRAHAKRTETIALLPWKLSDECADELAAALKPKKARKRK